MAADAADFEEKGGRGSAIGHTFGVKVQKVQRAQKGRFLGWTGLTAGGFLSLTGPLAPRVVVAQWGHSVARVQKVQRVRPAFGRLVQRVAVAADAADYKKAGPRPPSSRPKPVSRQ